MYLNFCRSYKGKSFLKLNIVKELKLNIQNLKIVIFFIKNKLN